MAKDKGPISKHWSELLLTVVDGPDKGARFRLHDGRNVIGRIGDVVVEADGVSRQHACITVGEEIQIEDMGSTTGTVLNSRMLVGEDYVFDGDEIQIGPVGLRLSARRRENKAGLVGAILALFLGAVILLGGFLLQEYYAQVWSRRSSAAKAEQAEQTAVGETWRDWSTLVLPTRAELEAEGVPITVQSVETEFNLGEKLFNDRMLAPGNAYSSVVHFKRCLAIDGLLPIEQRPAVSRRALDYLLESQRMINHSCNSKVFTFIRSRQMRYWQGCYDALKGIIETSPLPNGPYNKWARDNVAKLDVMLNK